MTAATPQPPPLPGQTPVLPLVIADLEARAQMGRQKYGTVLMVENGRDHLMDAYAELLDLVMYFRAEIAVREQRRRHILTRPRHRPWWRRLRWWRKEAA